MAARRCLPDGYQIVLKTRIASTVHLKVPVPRPTRFVIIFRRDFIGYLAISSSLWIKATAPSPPRNR